METSRGILFSKFVVWLLALAAVVYAFSNGAPPRTTGAPGEPTCQICHTGGDRGKVVVTFPNGLFYTPRVKQTFTITITEPTPGVGGYGFEMTARLESDLVNGQAGDFSPGDLQQVICDDGSVKGAQGCPPNKPVQFIEHSVPSISNVIPVDWTPPNSSSGNVHIYVAVVAATQGSFDHSYHAASTLAPMTGPPAITAVLNGASFLPGIQTGSWASIRGTSLANSRRTWNAKTEIINDKLPTSLDGVSVTINGKAAVVYYISPGQLNILPADDSALGPVEVRVAVGNSMSNAAIAQLQKYSPAFFMFDPQGRKYIAAQIARSDGGRDLLGPPGLFGSAVTTRPAKPGEFIILYGTGFGPTNPPVPSGQVFNGAAPTSDPVVVTIGGVDAKVQFAGISGAGLYQLNVVVPNLGDGDQKVVATIGGLNSQDHAFIAVKN